jgi:hypothetical protein
MSEGISYGGSLTTAEAEDSVNFEVIGYLQNYACNLVSAFSFFLCSKLMYVHRLWMFGCAGDGLEGWKE